MKNSNHNHNQFIRSIGFLMLMSALIFANCKKSVQPIGSSPFEYREIYLPQLGPEENRPLSLNTVDDDWGIWGHNLSEVLPDRPSPNVYAKIGNAVDESQFCFSSKHLFEYITKYIKDNFGKGQSLRFAILPNDNSVVCQCKRCVELGNTEDDASGAVYYMLERLTEYFPNHYFFTSFYRTTCSLPPKPLPENAGVLISAIQFPLSACYTPKEDDFIMLLQHWSAYTKRIYIWDYINNFDDYFTPFPIFEIFQHRLQIYAKAGVKGVFLNGSGRDYCTFYMLKLHVLSMLLSNPDANWRPILRNYCRQTYPVTGDVICDFIVKQENMVANQETPISLYDGVPVAVKTYLPAEEFLKFHQKLQNMLPKTKDNERKYVEKMVRATMLTHLELKRMASDTIGCKQMLQEMAKLTDEDIIAYSESGGTIDSYIEEYNYMLKRADETIGKNLLKGVKLKPLTELDEDYNDISILTDGLLGLPSCYHCGQLLSSADPALRIAIPHVEGLKHIRVNMTRNSIYHISLPLRIVLTANGHVLEEIVPKPSPVNLYRSSVDFCITPLCKGQLVLIIYRDLEDRTMALDEIEGF